MVKGGNRQRAEDWISLYNQTFEEDAVAIENQQANLFSSRSPVFRYVAKREEPAMFMLRETWTRMKEHLVDDSPERFADAAE